MSGDSANGTRSVPARLRCLSLHADDFGMNPAVNAGIVRGFRQGLLTSTSVLSNAPDAARALNDWQMLEDERAAGRLPSSETRKSLGDPDQPFDVGVHLNLTQGRPLTGSQFPADLLDAEGRFLGVFSLFARLWRHGARFREPICAELEQQIQFVCDHGQRPTHLNGHQYIEMMPVVAAMLPELARRFGIGAVRVACEPKLFRTTVMHRLQVLRWPLARVKRHFAEQFRSMIDAQGLGHPDAFFGTAHAGGIDLPLLERFVICGEGHRRIEIGLHPGEAALECGDKSSRSQLDGWHDPLAAHRPRELAMLVSSELPTCVGRLGWRLGRIGVRA